MDTGSFEFEKTEIHKHFVITQDVCKSVFGVNNLFFEIIPCKEYDSNSPLISNSLSHIKNSYYYGMRIKVKIIADGVEYEIGDGGLLDWTQKLLANKKERMLTMGLGIQLLHLFRK